MTISVADGITLPPGTTVTTIPGGSGAGGGGTTITDPIIPGTIQGTGLISGGSVRWNSGLNFTIAAARYQINQVVYNSLETNVTLDNPIVDKYRVDAFVLTNSSTAGKVTGPTITIATTPDQTIDPVLDPATQVKLNTVMLAPNAFAPTCKSTTIFDEGSGWPTEWIATGTGGFNVASTVSPYQGTKCIEATAATQNARLEIGTAGQTIDPQDYDMLFFNIKPKGDWGTQSLVLQWRYDTTLTRSEVVVLKQSSFNFDSKNAAYQMIGIPIKAFGSDSLAVNTLVFTVMGTGGGIGFYLDNVLLQSGLQVSQQSDRMRWAGAWTAARQQFKVNDVVTYGNVQYRCAQSSEGPGAITPVANVGGTSPTALWEDMSGDMVAVATQPTWNLINGKVFTLLLTANIANFAAPVGMMEGRKYTLILIQDATGGRTVGAWDVIYKWPFPGTPPSLSTAAGARDVIEFTYLSGTNTPSGHTGMHGRMISGAAATPSPTLTNTQVGYGSPSNLLTGSVDLIYNTNTGTFTQNKSVNGSTGLYALNQDPGAAATPQIRVQTGTGPGGYAGVSKAGLGYTASGLITPDTAMFENSTGKTVYLNNAATDFVWSRGGWTAASEVMRMADGVLSLGVSPSKVGSLAFNNLTSGSVTITPAVGALGANVLTAPAKTGVLAINPMTTVGDLVVGGTAGLETRLPAGATAGYVLASNGANVAPSYQPLSGLPTGAIPALTFRQVAYGDIQNKMKSGLGLNFVEETSTVQISKDFNGASGILINNGSTTAGAGNQIYFQVGSETAQIMKLGATYVAGGLYQPKQLIFENITGPSLFSNQQAADHVFSAGGPATAADERFRIYNSKAIGIRSQDVTYPYNLKIISSVIGAAADATIDLVGVAGATRQLQLAANLLVQGSGTIQLNNPVGGTTVVNLPAAPPGGGTLMFNPMLGAGDLIIGDTDGTARNLPASIVTPGYLLTRVSTPDNVAWQAPAWMRYRGVWSAAVQYSFNDVVTYGGSNYLAPGQVTLGQAPPTGWTALNNCPGRTTLTDAATVTWNVALAPVGWITLGGNRVINVTNDSPGQTYALQVNQGPGGGFTPSWGAMFHWPNGRLPILTGSVNNFDLFTFICLAPGWLAGTMQPAYS